MRKKAMEDEEAMKAQISTEAKTIFDHLYGRDAAEGSGHQIMFELGAWTAFQLTYQTNKDRAAGGFQAMLSGYAAGWLAFAHWMHWCVEWASRDSAILNAPAYSAMADGSPSNAYAIVREDEEMNETVVARTDTLEEAQSIALGLNTAEVLVSQMHLCPDLANFCPGERWRRQWPSAAELRAVNAAT
jgi:hypothetical protein